MLLCPQGAAAYPENEDQQQRLREAAEGLRVATNAAAQNAIKKKLVNRLEVSQRNRHVLMFQFGLFSSVHIVENEAIKVDFRHQAKGSTRQNADMKHLSNHLYKYGPFSKCICVISLSPGSEL